MRRGYTRGQYLDTVALLRDHVPALALTTDVIVGYPGETEEEFQETVDLVEEVGFDGVFVFMYSPRPGTTAVRLPDDVPGDEKLRRLQVINGMQQRAQERQNRSRIGRREQVLVDTVTGEGPRGGPDPRLPDRASRRRRGPAGPDGRNRGHGLRAERPVGSPPPASH